MWKLTLLAAAASLASAQTYTTSAPFTLQLTSTADATINGQFLEAAHAGAAIEVLALAGTDGTPSAYNTYNLNVTDTFSDDETYETGLLVWTLPGSTYNESEGLLFTPSLTSNVVAPMFEPGYSYNYLGFDDEDKLFMYSNYVDESNFTEGTYPTEVPQVPLYQWYACYTYFESYYYQTLAWVTTGQPLNPTCVAVNVTRTFV